MIQAEVKRGDAVILQRTYYDPQMTLETAIKALEMYIIQEMLNAGGECLIRVRFANLPQEAA